MDDYDVIFDLPWPPSANTYWRHTPIPLGKKCPMCHKPTKIRYATLISKEGREWIKTIGRILFSLDLPVMEGPLEMLVVLHPPTRRSYDVDNRSKALLDSLKKRKDPKQVAYLFPDDDQIVDLRILKGAICSPEGKCVVKIKKIQQSQGTLEFSE